MNEHAQRLLTTAHGLKVKVKMKANRQVTDPPNNDKNFQWQRDMENGYKGKPRTPGRVLPPGTFTKNPSEMVNVLKQHSEDYGQASSKLNSYINRSGKNLQGEDKNRLYDAKQALKEAYGDQSKQEANSETPVYALPPGHNLDDSVLYTGLDDLDIGDEKMSKVPATKLGAALRLTAADKWVKKVKPDHNAVPAGTFEKSAEDIAKTLKRVSDSHSQASERLNFYKNRGGSNLSGDDHKKLDHASDLLSEMYD